jgi:hypothetical protein
MNNETVFSVGVHRARGDLSLLDIWITLFGDESEVQQSQDNVLPPTVAASEIMVQTRGLDETVDLTGEPTSPVSPI